MQGKKDDAVKILDEALNKCPDGNVFAIEIKSSDNPSRGDINGLFSFKEVCPKANLLCAALVTRKRLEGACTIYPWQEIFEVLQLV